jgi:hypothetical protein
VTRKIERRARRLRKVAPRKVALSHVRQVRTSSGSQSGFTPTTPMPSTILNLPRPTTPRRKASSLGSASARKRGMATIRYKMGHLLKCNSDSKYGEPTPKLLHRRAFVTDSGFHVRCATSNENPVRPAALIARYMRCEMKINGVGRSRLCPCPKSAPVIAMSDPSHSSLSK